MMNQPSEVVKLAPSGGFSKGRDRSHMVSDFLVQYPSEPFFELSNNECEACCRDI